MRDTMAHLNAPGSPPPRSGVPLRYDFRSHAQSPLSDAEEVPDTVPHQSGDHAPRRRNGRGWKDAYIRARPARVVPRFKRLRYRGFDESAIRSIGPSTVSTRESCSMSATTSTDLYPMRIRDMTQFASSRFCSPIRI